MAVKESVTLKRVLSLLLAVVVLILSGCGGNGQVSASEPQAEITPEPSAEESVPGEVETSAPAMPDFQSEESGALPEDSAKTGILVMYFSRTGEQYNVGVIEKGNTAIVAEMIAEYTGADLYEVLPADDHYPMTYKELTDVGLQEQRDHARPAYAGELPDFSGYDTIFFGAPVWWGDWPMIMYTVFESAELSGKTLIPFSTHGGSGLSGFDKSLAAAFPDCTVLTGLAIAGTDAQRNQDKVRNSVDSWLDGLDF
jgi:flavodoxin